MTMRFNANETPPTDNDSASGYLIPGLVIAGAIFYWWERRQARVPRGGEIRRVGKRGRFGDDAVVVSVPREGRPGSSILRAFPADRSGRTRADEYLAVVAASGEFYHYPKMDTVPFDDLSAWWVKQTWDYTTGDLKARIIEASGHRPPAIDPPLYGPYRTVKSALRQTVPARAHTAIIENARYKLSPPRDWSPRVIRGGASDREKLGGFGSFGESIRYKTKKKGKGYFTSVCSGDTCIGGAGKTKDRSVASAMRALAREFGRG